MFVSMTQTVLQQREQFHTSRLIEHIDPTAPQYSDAVRAATEYFASKGSSSVDAASRATAWIGQAISQQAQLFAYIDVFFVLGMICIAANPLVLLLRPVDHSRPTSARALHKTG